MTTPAIDPAFFPSRCQRLWRWLCNWPSDVLLWLSILVLIAGLLVFWRHQTVSGMGPQTLVLHSSDANDIKPGSNVYFLGVHVGTVEEVRFPFDELRDGVALVVATQRELPPLPKNIKGHILFNGLAGAKEIHLEAPKDGRAIIPEDGQHGQQLVELDEPIRLRDVMNMNVEVNNYLKQGAQSLSMVFGREGVQGHITLLQDNILASQTMTTEATRTIANTTQTLNQWIPLLAKTVGSTSRQLAAVADQVAGVEAALSEVQSSQPFARLQDGLTSAERVMSNIDAGASRFDQRTAHLCQTLDAAEAKLCELQKTNSLSPGTWSQQLQSFVDALEAANQRVGNWTKPKPTTEKPAIPVPSS